MPDTISVPITMVSLAAAIEDRLAAITLDSPPEHILAIVDLVDSLDAALDRLALALPDEPVTSIDTGIADLAVA